MGAEGAEQEGEQRGDGLAAEGHGSGSIGPEGGRS
jgi:hypothetical protein